MITQAEAARYVSYMKYIHDANVNGESLPTLDRKLKKAVTIASGRMGHIAGFTGEFLHLLNKFSNMILVYNKVAIMEGYGAAQDELTLIIDYFHIQSEKPIPLMKKRAAYIKQEVEGTGKTLCDMVLEAIGG